MKNEILVRRYKKDEAKGIAQFHRGLLALANNQGTFEASILKFDDKYSLVTLKTRKKAPGIEIMDAFRVAVAAGGHYTYEVGNTPDDRR